MAFRGGKCDQRSSPLFCTALAAAAPPTQAWTAALSSLPCPAALYCPLYCLPQARYNVMEALVYLGPLTFAFLATGAYCFEWDQGLSTVVSAAARQPQQAGCTEP